MISFVFKFCIFFTLSFAILNIPIGSKKIFNHLNYYTQPIKKQLTKSFKGTSNLGKQLFINSNPRHSIYNDSIAKKQSAILKKRRNQVYETDEDISDSEKANLIQVIDSSKN